MQTQLFIDGQWVDAEAGSTFASVEPSTGRHIADIAKASRRDAVSAVEAARRAFDEGPWPRLSGAERADVLGRAADILESRQAELAQLEARDSGGTIRKAVALDLPLSVGTLRYFAGCARSEPEEYGHGENPSPPAVCTIRREPYGVCAGIVPWNFPLLMAVWKVAPALAAGNTLVLKPASHTPLTAIELVRACAEAGVPAGAVNVVSGPGPIVGEELASHPLVDKVAFTGSTEVGRRIMHLGSGTVKKVTLELGGKSANIVLPDADLDTAASGVLFGTFFHNGQVCESGTRALIHADIYDEFVAMLVDRVGKLVIGDNLDPVTDLGPLVAPSQVERVKRYVQLGLDEGAKLLCGGDLPAGLPSHLDASAFFAPTIFEAANDMRIAQEEIFGPVLCVIKVASDDEAVRIANDSIYGLGGGVWSRDLERAHRVAAAMRTGSVWINDYHGITPTQPFGGYRQSGIGRELSEIGFNEYRQIKHVWRSTAAESGGYGHFALLSPGL